MKCLRSEIKEQSLSVQMKQLAHLKTKSIPKFQLDQWYI